MLLILYIPLTHQGFFLHKRIDVSKDIAPNRVVPTLVHEFTHYVHSLIEPEMAKSGGSLKVLFDDRYFSVYERELIRVTNFVDSHSKFEKLNEHKNMIKERIDGYEKIIRQKYPKFMRSKKFAEFDKYIKKSNAKYLLKYDRVKLITGMLFKKIEILSIDNIERDFADMPAEFTAYIRLKSCQRKQRRISAKINKLNKYYKKPTELFARFVEGMFIDCDMVKKLAPMAYDRFNYLIECGYYPYMGELFELSKSQISF